MNLDTVIIGLVGVLVLVGTPLLTNWALKGKLMLSQKNIDISQKISDLEQARVLAKQVALETSNQLNAQLKTVIDPIAVEIAGLKRDNEQITKQVVVLTKDKEIRDDFIISLKNDNVEIKAQQTILVGGFQNIMEAMKTVVAQRDGIAEEILTGVNAAIAEMKSNLSPETRKEINK